MSGPPGSGKSMLAQRMPGLLPAMGQQQALESAAVLSLAGQFQPAMWGRRPYRQPHHSATMAALVGGGAPPKPGEISLAHHGLLFLDELPEFPRLALEALREPLENGRITLSRARHQAEFPAQFQWMAAMNPCPCGYLGASQPACRCSREQITRYQARLSGPLLDRIDMQVHVAALLPQELMQAPAGESSAVVQARCQQAYDRAVSRRGVSNHRLTAAQLQDLRIDQPAQQCLQQQATQSAWSARTVHRDAIGANHRRFGAGRRHPVAAYVASPAFQNVCQALSDFSVCGAGFLGRCSQPLWFHNGLSNLFTATRSHGHGAYPPHRGYCRRRHRHGSHARRSAGDG
jgi:magnesium chelatase family protein